MLENRPFAYTSCSIPEHPSRPFLYQTLCEHSGGLVGRAAKWALRCNTQLVYSTLLLLLFAGNILRIFAIWKNSQNLVPAKMSTIIPGVTNILGIALQSLTLGWAATSVHALLFFLSFLPVFFFFFFSSRCTVTGNALKKVTFDYDHGRLRSNETCSYRQRLPLRLHDHVTCTVNLTKTTQVAATLV